MKLFKKVRVGADAFIGPLQHVAYSPQTNENCFLFLGGNAGIAPLRLRDFVFTDTLRAGMYPRGGA